MTLFQMLAVAFGLSMTLITVRNAVRREISIFQTLIWLMIWGILILFSSYLQFLDLIASLLQTGLPIESTIAITSLMLFALTYNLYLKIEDTRKQIVKIVTSMALTEAKSKIEKLSKEK